MFRACCANLWRSMLLTWHCAELNWAAAGSRENCSWWMESLWLSRLWAFARAKKTFRFNGRHFYCEMDSNNNASWTRAPQKNGTKPKLYLRCSNQNEPVPRHGRREREHEQRAPQRNTQKITPIRTIMNDVMWLLYIFCHWMPFLPIWIRSGEFVPNKSALSTFRLLLCSAHHCLFVCFSAHLRKCFVFRADFWWWKLWVDCRCRPIGPCVLLYLVENYIFRLLHVQLSWFQSISHPLCGTGAIRVCFLSFSFACDHLPAAF